MRHHLIPVSVSLLVLALIAPAAHGESTVRHLTLDGSVAAGRGAPEGAEGLIKLGIDYLVKPGNGHKRLIPHRVTSVSFHAVYVSCDQESAPDGSFVLNTDFGGVAGIKITKKRFSHKYTARWLGNSQLIPPIPEVHSTFQIAGQKMWQERTKWRGRNPNPNPPGKKFFWKKASGSLNILDLDWLAPAGPPAEPAPPPTNCMTNGPRSWSVHQCRQTSSDPAYLPSCLRVSDPQ